mmetsp:Transcript_426/g.1107  ORF Transcript_426/g.1107 Transcript_426/m.1107 type:complete len:373 (-) Transcript_426:82-1200(-)
MAAESITADMIAPALAMLGIDEGDACAHPELCCVLTTPKAPHIIRAADDAWCQTWEILPHEAAGKTLGLIAGPRSSNPSVGARLAAATSNSGGTAAASVEQHTPGKAQLDSWVDCGKAVNYTTRTGTAIEHHLVIGPVHDARGDVNALVGVSRILSPAPTNEEAAKETDEPLFASIIGAHSPSETSTLFAAAFSRPIMPAPAGRAARHRSPRFKPHLRRRASRLRALADAKAHASTAGPALAPQLPPRFEPRSRAYDLPSSPLLAGASDEMSPSPSPPAREWSYAHMLAERELGTAEDELMFRSMLESTDVRIVLASACTADVRDHLHKASDAAGSDLPQPRPIGEQSFKFKRLGHAPRAPIARRRRLRTSE